MTEKKEIREQIVLIVEDNLSNYEIAKTFLNDMNICCESATDGIEALDMYDTRGKGYYSAILMDINLPRLNGLQTAARLRIRDDCIPVIAMTAYRSDTHFMNDAYDLFDSVISKPFDFATFRSVISSYIPVDVQQPPHFDDSSHREDTKKRDVINTNICDVDRGISNMGGNADLFIKHFNNFKQNNVDLAMRLRCCVDKKHYSEAATLCHSAKGVTGMLALSDVYEGVMRLEDMLAGKTCLTTDEEERTDTLLASISDSVRQVCRIQL